MGLLDKFNPEATRKSVTWHAILGAVVCAVGYWIASSYKPWLIDVWLFGYPLAAALGAFIFGIVEWQVDD